jgi:nitroreductase
MATTGREALEQAVRDALRAPSIFNTQPWRWRIGRSGLELWADPTRQLDVTDPYGHELLLSCGAALHHALVSLAATGWAVTVDRYGDRGDRLARIDLVGRAAEADPEAVALRAAIPVRRTDRRPYADQPVPDEIIDALTVAAAASGVRLHRVRYDQMPMFAVAVAFAGSAETGDPTYLSELSRWTNRPQWNNDGVPPATAVRRVPRRVPVREFALNPHQGLPAQPGGDLGAAYLVLHGPGTTRTDRLRAGEALSAVLLTAVARGLRVAPITDVIEVDHPRDLVRGLLPERDEPYAAVRCGYPVDTTELPATPRRWLADVVRPEELP